jgi:hypothetical protein
MSGSSSLPPPEVFSSYLLHPTPTLHYPAWLNALAYLYTNTMSYAGPDTAELVATKAKGLPRIIISLDRVVASALKDIIANFSLALYESYKTK